MPQLINEIKNRQAEDKKFFVNYLFNLVSVLVEKLKQMVFRVEVINKQEFPKTIKVENLNQDQIVNGLYDISKALELYSSVVARSNKQQPIQKVQIEGIEKLTQKSELKIPSSFEVKNLDSLIKKVSDLTDILSKPEDEKEEIKEESLFNEDEKSQIFSLLTNLNKLSGNPQNPIAVRLSDGKGFYEAIVQAFSAGGSSMPPSYVGESGPQRQNVDVLAGYYLADTDETTTTKYWGFTKSNGIHYILKETTSSGILSYRYYSGGTDTDYSTAWTNRASKSYDYFYTVF